MCSATSCQPSWAMIQWTRPGNSRKSVRAAERPEGARLERPDTARRRGVDGDARSADAPVEQDLREQPAERVADQDRRLRFVEVKDEPLVVIDDLVDAQALERRWVGADRL